MHLPKARYSLYIFCVALACAVGVSRCSAQAHSSSAAAEHLFDFHNGFWANLHHFLYRQALLSTPQKGSNSLALTKADVDELQRLSPADRASWDSAISYYANSLVKRDLLFDEGMEDIKNRLEDAEESPDLANVQIPADVKMTLLKAAPIYREHWWPRHHAENQQWIAALKPLVQQYGATLEMEMVKIYAQSWPQYPVRVDAVAYSNWAGAYTTLYPTRPTISTADSANQGTAALEILFHETSHGMMDKVMEDIRAAEADLNAHRTKEEFHSGSIWHAVLFYTAGELVAEHIAGYVPYADKNGLWVRVWPSPDRSLIEQDWKPHMQDSVELQPALTKLIADLASASGVQSGRVTR